MVGKPQLREHGWLYGDDPDVPLAVVRLFERRDGSGVWDLYLSDPASAPGQHVEHPSEASARAELARVYAEGRRVGVWRIWRPEPY